MKNQVIKNLTPETGKEIIKYFQGLGVDTRGNTGCYNEAEGNIAIYYGVINGRFGNYTIYNVIDAKATIIELPKQQQFKRGDKVWVWDNDESKAVERIFLCEIEGTDFPIIVVDKYYEEEFYKGEIFGTDSYENCKASSLVELTLQDISDGKGVGVPVELIIIRIV